MLEAGLSRNDRCTRSNRSWTEPADFIRRIEKARNRKAVQDPTVPVETTSRTWA